MWLLLVTPTLSFSCSDSLRREAAHCFGISSSFCDIQLLFVGFDCRPFSDAVTAFRGFCVAVLPSRRCTLQFILWSLNAFLSSTDHVFLLSCFDFGSDNVRLLYNSCLDWCPSGSSVLAALSSDTFMAAGLVEQPNTDWDAQRCCLSGVILQTARLFLRVLGKCLILQDVCLMLFSSIDVPWVIIPLLAPIFTLTNTGLLLKQFCLSPTAVTQNWLPPSFLGYWPVKFKTVLSQTSCWGCDKQTQCSKIISLTWKQI